VTSPYVDRRSGQSQHRCSSTNAMRWFPLTLIVFGLLLSLACGGSRYSSTPPSSSYTIGGTVYGLSGAGLALQNNGSNNLTVSASGSFTFTGPRPSALPVYRHTIGSKEFRVPTGKKIFTLTARPWQFLPSDFLLPRTQDADRNCRLRPCGH
jgi:hypothetical protein